MSGMSLMPVNSASNAANGGSEMNIKIQKKPFIFSLIFSFEVFILLVFTGFSIENLLIAGLIAVLVFVVIYVRKRDLK